MSEKRGKKLDLRGHELPEFLRKNAFFHLQGEFQRL
jgi:hypothetical protein